jgi:hypothetical protein
MTNYKKLRVLSLLIATSFSTYISIASAENISIKQVTKDITFLASDQLKGRANFSPEIDKAADYISQRFSDIGLKKFNGLKTYKQTFNITSITPKSTSVTLNGNNIVNNQIALATTINNLSWNSTKNITTTVIGKKDDMRSMLRELNNKGGKHLVLINKAHEETFTRYKNYFEKGITKLSLAHQGALVLVLTDEVNVKNIAVNASIQLSTKSLSNVVAVLPGKSKANEMVLFSAHYDHLGETKDGKAVFNGADDDASGTTAVINLAEHFAKQQNNARTLVFSAFTAEEIGGFGSRYFSQQLNPDDVVAMINIEMIGKPSKFGAGTIWMTGMERSNLGKLLNASLKPHSMQVYKDPYPEQGLFYRSDNATLARLGVPAHSFSSTQLDKDEHYHQTSDNLESLDLNSMHKVIESLSIASEDIVNGKITPTRVDVEKVRGHGKIY